MSASEQVRIERPVYGGAGLAKTSSGAIALVPYALPQELVEITPSGSGPEARLLQIIEPSPFRVEPHCIHFGRCGGCQYQHASYEEQLRIKHKILTETMERSGVSAFPEETLHSSELWEYRNRIRLRIEEVDGEFRAGYSIRGTNEFLAIEMCPISAPLLVLAAFSMLRLANASLEPRVLFAVVKEVELFMNETASGLSLTLLTAKSTAVAKHSFAKFCDGLKGDVPELVGAGLVSSPANSTSRVELAAWCAPGLAYSVAKETYWVSRGGFFQVNRFLIAPLVDLVCGNRSGDLAWDLFAGVGLFSRVLVHSFKQMTAVEANTTAIRDLQSAFAKVGSPHKVVQAATLKFLRDAVVQRDRPDFIVLDPPRAGAGAEACELLLRIGAPEMVYVSCDPTTLARDLVVLQRGYDIEQANLVDLFPQTYHMEAVVVLKRR